jgi:hypothetical protein
MPSAKKPDAPLVDAVTRFDAELRRYEALVDETARLKITSDKHVGRAHRALEECAEEEQRLVALLGEFVGAMRAAQGRQERAMAIRVQAAERVEQKIRSREELLARLGKLGELAREVSGAIAALFAGKPGISREDVIGSLGEVDARTAPIVAEAESLRAAAEEAEWLDIARDADSFKQQLAAARKKMQTLAKPGAETRSNGIAHDGEPQAGGDPDEGSADPSA